MYAVTKKVGAVLDLLTDPLYGVGAHMKVENAKGIFMPVSVECTEKANEPIVRKCKCGKGFEVPSHMCEWKECRECRIKEKK